MIDIIIPTLSKEQGEETGRLALITAGLEARVTVVYDKDHQGFTKTVNRGIRQTAGEVCLLNDDVRVFQYGWLRILHDTLMSGSSVGIVGPSGRCASVNKAGVSGDYGYQNVHMLPFWCVLIKRAVFDEIGLLDEDFIHYSSDTWFCRLARRAGYRVIWDKSVYLEHDHQGSGLIKEWRIHDREVLVRKGRKLGIRYEARVM